MTQAGANTPANHFGGTFGPNEWLVQEMYERYQQDPSSVDKAWWDFFADFKGGSSNGSSSNGAANNGAANQKGTDAVNHQRFMRSVPSLSVPASVGFIALWGIATLNGVVLVSYIRSLRNDGMPVEQAVMEGAKMRFRPVMMTALAILAPGFWSG